MIDKLKRRAAALKMETMALYLACKSPQTPFLAKFIAAAVVAYALSPIDLIPDFIPVLGYLDDLILVPFGISLAIRLIPKDILEKCRIEAKGKLQKSKAGGSIAAIVIIIAWASILLLAAWLVYRAIA